jgi:hypothetical protein
MKATTSRWLRGIPLASILCVDTYYMKLRQQFSNLVHLVLNLFNLHKEAQQVTIVTAQQQNNPKNLRNNNTTTIPIGKQTNKDERWKFFASQSKDNTYLKT